MSRLDHKTKPLHILAVGGDVEMISRLLHFGLRFLDNTTSLTAGQSVTGHVTQDKYSSASYFVE
ncbi:hypothetical protein MAR_022237, partial [Mya arenaria]